MPKIEVKSELNESSSIQEEIKHECLSLVDQFTMHGLPNVFRARNAFMRVAWFILFLASTGVCTWLTVKAIMEYLNYEVVTKIRIHTEIPFQLPAITICNTNPFNEDFALLDKVQSLYQNFTMDLEKYSIQIQKLIMLSLIKYFKYNENSKQKLSFSYEKFFIGCRFEEYPCESIYWNWYFDLIYGNCFTFNSGRTENGTKLPHKTLKKIGKYFGLEVELFVGNPKNNYSLSTDYGVHVFIHNQSQLPNSYTGLNFPTGFASNIAISKLVNNRLEYPYSECKEDFGKFDTELYEFLIKTNNFYSQADCFDLCIQKEIAKACNCTYILFQNLFNLQPCQDEKCIVDVWVKTIDHLKEHCEKYCPLECRTISYPTTITSNRYPTQSYANVLLDKYKLQSQNWTKNVTYEDLRDNILALYFYVESFEYTEITEIASQTVIDLISACGGLFGLFIGISFLSVFEIFDLALRSFFIYFKRRQELTQIKNFE